MSVCVYVSKIIGPYSIIDLYGAIYAVLRYSLGQCCRFLLRKQSVELALLHVFVICSFHFRYMGFMAIALACGC